MYLCYSIFQLQCLVNLLTYRSDDRRLTCFCCLQHFPDVGVLQSHFERTHCQQQSPSDQHAVSSSTLASATSGPITSGSGVVWDRLRDGASSYLSGGGAAVSPADLLSLFSAAVPPELLLPPVYPATGSGILPPPHPPPPAMLMMMLAAATSPFVGCPPSLLDQHAGHTLANRQFTPPDDTELDDGRIASCQAMWILTFCLISLTTLYIDSAGPIRE